MTSGEKSPNSCYIRKHRHMDPFYLAILLYVAAVVLAFVDLFIPSGGMLIILAGVGALASVLFGFRSSTTMGMSMLTLVVTSIPAFAFAAIKIWPRTPIGRRIILGTPISSKNEKHDARLHSLVGLVVSADYPLMPGGQIKIGSKRYNAIAESGMVEAGEHVEIIGYRERNLVVRVTTAKVTAVGQVPNSATSADQDTEASKQENLLDRPAEELGLDSID